MAVLWDASHSMIECRRHRLQPHPNQEAKLNRQLGVLRRLWNHALEERQTAWQERRESITFRQQCKSLTTWRKEDPEGLGQISAQAAQAQLRRLDDAFKRFFKGIAKYPRFKAFGEQASLTFPQAAGTEIGRRSGKIRLSCIGYVPIIQHRDEPEGDKLKTITVKQEASQWYALLAYEVPDAPKPSGEIHAPIGIDLGLKNLVTLSDGETVAPPRLFAKSERRVRLAQRIMSRRKKGSGNRLRARRRLARCHAKVERQRNDYLHKLSANLVSRFDFIAMEDMSVAELQAKGFRPLRRGITDAGWGKLRQFIAYKAMRASKHFVLVPARGTTQTCSACGAIPLVKLTLQDRIHACPCGKIMDRDHNAAKNILARGLAAQSTVGHTGINASGETRPPKRPSRVLRVLSVKEEPLLRGTV